MTDRTPCSDPANDPDDWFISKDGRQYADEELVTEEEVMAHLNEVDPHGTRSASEIRRVWDRMEVDRKRDNLARRRHAREKCHEECYFRTHCLQNNLDMQVQHGTWGGYYEEDLRKLQAQQRRRQLPLLD